MSATRRLLEAREPDWQAERDALSKMTATLAKLARELAHNETYDPDKYSLAKKAVSDATWAVKKAVYQLDRLNQTGREAA